MAKDSPSKDCSHGIGVTGSTPLPSGGVRSSRASRFQENAACQIFATNQPHARSVVAKSTAGNQISR